MPIYEYICQSCGQHKETLQKVSDPPLTLCEACGKDTLKKMISSTSFQLKGGGWYETDFKNKKKSAATENKDTKEPKTEGSEQKDVKSDNSSSTKTSEKKTSASVEGGN